MTMTELDRRAFLAAAGAAALIPGRRAAAAAPPSMIIVNALGGLDDPNVEREAGPSAMHLRPGDRRRPRLRPHRGQRHHGLCRRRRGAVRADDARDRPLGRAAAAAARRPPPGAERRRHPPREARAARSASSTASRTRRCWAPTRAGSRSSPISACASSSSPTIRPTRSATARWRRQNRGLTPFGREVVERLNAARLMVDLSHSGERTCLDAARASTRADLDQPYRLPRPRRPAAQQDRRGAAPGRRARRLRRHLLHAVPRRRAASAPPPTSSPISTMR